MKPLYMLDTNMVIYLMKNQAPEVAQRFAQCRAGEVVVSAVTAAELHYGLSNCGDPESARQQLVSLFEDIPVTPFNTEAACCYGPVRHATRDRKQDHLDKLIAAHAIALDTTLVTNNVRDFARYPGLRVENWLAAT